MEYYTDGKWNPNSPSTSSKPPAFTMMRSMSQRGVAGVSSSNDPPLPRSYSQRNPAEVAAASSSSSSKSASNFGRKCKNLAKEQKAKFYIVKRCIAMLVRRNKHRDDDDDDDS